MAPSSGKRTTTSLVVLIAAVLLIGSSVYVSKTIQPEQTQPMSTVAQQSKDQNSPAGIARMTADSTNYKDGEYSATGGYTSPGGSQKITIKISLSGGVIKKTSATADNDGSYTSTTYQESFIKNYPKKIIGKKINSVKLDQVGSSSLTSNGFNSALEMIKNQSKI